MTGIRPLRSIISCENKKHFATAWKALPAVQVIYLAKRETIMFQSAVKSFLALLCNGIFSVFLSTRTTTLLAMNCLNQPPKPALRSRSPKRRHWLSMTRSERCNMLLGCLFASQKPIKTFVVSTEKDSVEFWKYSLCADACKYCLKELAFETKKIP